MEPTYSDFGLDFTSEPVNKQHGPNKSDATLWRKDAQIPRVTDLEKFRAHFGDLPILAALDGTSFRVMAQGVARSKPANTAVAILREIVYNRLRGLTTRTQLVQIKEVRTFSLPDGTTYEGTDEVEYQQLFAAALIDAGVDNATALALAGNQHLTK